MKEILYSLRLGVTGLGLKLILIGIVLLLVTSLYKLIFKVKRLKREYKILEAEGMLEARFTEKLDKEIKQYQSSDEIVVQKNLEPRKLKVKRDESGKVIKYANVDPGSGIMNDESGEYATSLLDIPYGEEISVGSVKDKSSDDDTATALMEEVELDSETALMTGGIYGNE